MTAHRHAALMLQYAQDAMETNRPWERWQYSCRGKSKRWEDADSHLAWNPNTEYRHKPKMMKATCADGTEVKWPEPMREAPELGTTYYIAAYFGYSSPYEGSKWADDDIDRCRLHSGMLHKTKEAAEMHTQALIALSRGSANWEQES